MVADLFKIVHLMNRSPWPMAVCAVESCKLTYIHTFPEHCLQSALTNIELDRINDEIRVHN